MSQLDDFRHSFDDAEQILVVSDLYKEENDQCMPDTDLSKPNKAPQQLTELINRSVTSDTLLLAIAQIQTHRHTRHTSLDENRLAMARA